MKLYKLSGILTILAFFTLFLSCEDETPTVGSVIAAGEVEISIDTFYFDLGAKAYEMENFDSKTGNLMVGSIQNPDYGVLTCSFVSRFMCSPNLLVADSLLNPERVDSCKLILGAQRGNIIGDSLAPQRLTVFPLTKQLPSNIANTFNPEGYFDPSNPLASRSYTLSAISEKDSAFFYNSFVELTVDLPVDFGKTIFKKYIEEPEIFQWPQTMAEKFLPGIYVQHSFGNGCIANITSAYVAVFYYNLETTTTVVDKDTITGVKHVGNVAFPFTISPEVLSSNNISYVPSEKVKKKNELNDGDVVITTPGGYFTRFQFPAGPIIDRYYEKETHLSSVNDMILYIPAEAFDDSSGITEAETLLLVKTSEYENFFNQNKTPDNQVAFTGVYDSVNKRYYFTTMRSYFLDLLKKETLDPEDLDFTIIPVEIQTETVPNYYGDASTYVTKCVPYTSRPTMTLLKTSEAIVTFSFSTQLID